MKKTYPTSTKSQQWAKHLKPFGKRLANKSTRKINKTIAEVGENETVKKPGKKPKAKSKFAIEYHNGNQVWRLWKKYTSEGRMNRSLENLIKKHGNSCFAFLREYEFRVKTK